MYCEIGSVFSRRSTMELKKILKVLCAFNGTSQNVHCSACSFLCQQNLHFRWKRSVGERALLYNDVFEY